MAFCPANTGRRKKKTAALDERLKRCYTIGTAAGFYRALALLVGGNMMSVMFLLFSCRSSSVSRSTNATMQMPDIASRRFGMAFTSLRFDSELEWCQARAVPVGKTDVKYYSTVFSAKQACCYALTSIEKDFSIFNRRAMCTPAWTRATPVVGARHRAPAFILFQIHLGCARYRLCTRSARIALSTASTITPTSAKIAAHMFARPSAPSARQANLTASAKTMF